MNWDSVSRVAAVDAWSLQDEHEYEKQTARREQLKKSGGLNNNIAGASSAAPVSPDPVLSNINFQTPTTQVSNSREAPSEAPERPASDRVAHSYKSPYALIAFDNRRVREHFEANGALTETLKKIIMKPHGYPDIVELMSYSSLADIHGAGYLNFIRHQVHNQPVGYKEGKQIKEFLRFMCAPCPISTQNAKDPHRITRKAWLEFLGAAYKPFFNPLIPTKSGKDTAITKNYFANAIRLEFFGTSYQFESLDENGSRGNMIDLPQVRVIISDMSRKFKNRGGEERRHANAAKLRAKELNTTSDGSGFLTCAHADEELFPNSPPKMIRFNANGKDVSNYKGRKRKHGDLLLQHTAVVESRTTTVTVTTTTSQAKKSKSSLIPTGRSASSLSSGRFVEPEGISGGNSYTVPFAELSTKEQAARRKEVNARTKALKNMDDEEGGSVCSDADAASGSDSGAENRGKSGSKEEEEEQTESADERAEYRKNDKLNRGAASLPDDLADFRASRRSSVEEEERGDRNPYKATKGNATHKAPATSSSSAVPCRLTDAARRASKTSAAAPSVLITAISAVPIHRAAKPKPVLSKSDAAAKAQKKKNVHD